MKGKGVGSWGVAYPYKTSLSPPFRPPPPGGGGAVTLT